jgi:hypothetical protein
MSDSTEIDKAIIARLSGDAQLLALLPDGVHAHVAPQGKTHFCIVSLVIARDVPTFGSVGTRRAGEECTYMMKAVTLGASRGVAGDAAQRIDELLQDQPLTITGYHCASIARAVDDGRIDETEVDDVDASIRWQHRGGRYQLLAIPTL